MLQLRIHYFEGTWELSLKLLLLLMDINELPRARDLLKALAPAESSGIPESTFELSRGTGSDIVPLIDQVRHCLCFTPDSLKWIKIVKLVFLEQVTSITAFVWECRAEYRFFCRKLNILAQEPQTKFSSFI